MIADLSLLALARYAPSWLHSIFHTSSLCTSSIVVVIVGKSAMVQWWSAYSENVDSGALW